MQATAHVLLEGKSTLVLVGMYVHCHIDVNIEHRAYHAIHHLCIVLRIRAPRANERSRNTPTVTGRNIEPNAVEKKNLENCHAD